MSKPILSFIVIILSLGAAFLYVKPEFDVAMKSRADIVTLDQTIQKSETIKKLINETSDNLRRIDKDSLARFAIFLPEEVDDIRFANSLQNIGYSNGIILEGINVTRGVGGSGAEDSLSAKSKLSGIILSTISVDRTDQSEKTNTRQAGVLDKKYKTTRANFSGTSSYGAFALFLDDLEKSLGLINITSLSFTPIKEASVGEKKDTSPILYQYTVDIETYSLK